MENEFFKYLIENQSKWAEMYKEQKKREHEEKKLKHQQYNINYKPIRQQTNKNKAYYVLG
jgi:hypothetical protein